MEAIECIKTRRSVRAFTDQKADRGLIEKAIAAAAFAPSWKNTQITRYIAIEDKALLNQICDKCLLEHNAGIVQGTQTLIAVTFIKNRSGFERDGSPTTEKGGAWQMFDAGIASQTFCLAAHDLGLATVIMGIFKEKELTELLEIPETQELAALIAVGCPAEQPEAPKKKTVTDLLTYK